MVGQDTELYRTFRFSLGLVAVVLCIVAGLFQSIVLGGVAVRPGPLTDRNQQLLVHQAIADVFFAGGAVFGVRSLWSKPDGLARQRLGRAWIAVGLGLGVLILSGLTEPPL